MSKQSIFIAATGQNVGKTTICLGLIAALRKKYPRVGFIKPVGQQHLKVDDETIVDKDAFLFRHYFEMECSWHAMSPVIIPEGFTRRYLDKEISSDRLLDDVVSSYQSISSNHDYTIVEGTGHVGVGSIVDLSNAKIAASLNLEMIIIASGGLGSSFDELATNISMCREYGVRVRGVILNRVLSDKREMILRYFPKALEKWGIPLLGCIPFDPFLNMPTIRDFESLFKTHLLSGERHRQRHFNNFRLFAGSVGAFLQEFEPDQLIITPACREDIIVATVENFLQDSGNNEDNFGTGMILTGKTPPSQSILEHIQKVDIPIMYAPLCSYEAMKKITTFIAKIRLEDKRKIQKAIDLVGNHVNLDL